MVVDNAEGKTYDYVYAPLFSPDSAHVVYIAVRGDKNLVVIDGTEGNKYDKILYDVAQRYTTVGSINFDSPGVLNYLAENYEGNIYLVE